LAENVQVDMYKKALNVNHLLKTILYEEDLFNDRDSKKMSGGYKTETIPYSIKKGRFPTVFPGFFHVH